MNDAGGLDVWYLKLFYDFGAQVPDEEAVLPMDAYPLMIDCNGFFVGSAPYGLVIMSDFRGQV